MIPVRPGAIASLLFVAFILFVLPGVLSRYEANSWLVGDGGFYLNMQKSLTWHGTLEQSQLHPHSWYDGTREIDDAFSNIARGRNGEWWPKHGYLMPVFTLPLYWAFGVDGTLIANVLSVSLVVVLSFLVARRFASTAAAGVAAFAVGVAGPHAEYAYNFSNDGFYTVWLLGAFASAFGGTPRRRVLAGVLFGLAVWTKITNVLFAPLLALAVLYGPGEQAARGREAVRQLVQVAAGAAVILTLYGIANTYMFGRPWITSYQRVLVVRAGELAVASHTDLFNVPFREGLMDVLFTRDHGLLTRYAPATLAWLGFIPLLVRRETRRLGLGAALTLLAVIAFFLRFKYYHERFLFPVFGLLVLPAAVLLDSALTVLSTRFPSPALQRLGAALCVGGLGAVAVTRDAFRREDRASDRIESAVVRVGDAPCDYFNNMRWSWECPGRRGDDQLIGVSGAQRHRFKGREARGLILAAGHESKKPIELTFPDFPVGPGLRIRFGLDDASRAPVAVEMAVTIGEREVLRRRVAEPGVLFEAPLEGESGSQPIRVNLTTTDQARARFVFDIRRPR